MIGRLATGSMGLGWLAVIGRSRVPSPPAITTAFKAFAAPSRVPLRCTPSPANSRARTGLSGTGRPTDQAPHLDEVQRRGPPVQRRPPDREGPADDPGQGPAPAGVIAEEQQREGIEQAQGGRLADQ